MSKTISERDVFRLADEYRSEDAKLSPKSKAMKQLDNFHQDNETESKVMLACIPLLLSAFFFIGGNTLGLRLGVLTSNLVGGGLVMLSAGFIGFVLLSARHRKHQLEPKALPWKQQNLLKPIQGVLGAGEVVVVKGRQATWIIRPNFVGDGVDDLDGKIVRLDKAALLEKFKKE